jgi:hypothetical protein
MGADGHIYPSDKTVTSQAVPLEIAALMRKMKRA